MANNTYTFDPKKGTLSAVTMIRASREYQCSCGHQYAFTLDWPEGMTQRGTINVNGVLCPQCQQPTALPLAEYWVEDFQLRSRPVDQ